MIALAAVVLLAPAAAEAARPGFSFKVERDPVTDCWRVVIDFHLTDGGAGSTARAFQFDLEYDPTKVTLHNNAAIASPPFSATIGSIVTPGLLEDVAGDTGTSGAFSNPNPDLVQFLFDNVIPNNTVLPDFRVFASSNDFVISGAGTFGPGDIDPIAVPEPASVTLALLAAPALLRRRRRAVR